MRLANRCFVRPSGRVRVDFEDKSDEMNLRSRKTHKSWLLVTAFVVGSFGPIFSLATQSGSDELARWTLDLLAWPLDGTQIYSEGAMRFLTALTGGFLLGWGVTILGLRH